MMAKLSYAPAADGRLLSGAQGRMRIAARLIGRIGIVTIIEDDVGLWGEM